MQPIFCDACGLATPAYDTVHYGSEGGSYRTLCGRCFNTDVARRNGLTDFEHVRFEPIAMTDASGLAHEFRFRAHLFGSGVAVNAFELHDDHPAGYQFQVIGDPQADLLALLGRLIEKMRRALAIKHVEDTRLGLQVTDDLVVRGKIDCDLGEEDGMPTVIVDGRDVSWSG